ncbi:mechanosensitive ion channel family protein [Lactobacillus sp. PV034]|uniref:mechanosensitive ion channel family protein n=1 Tax=Lactobacillus sp. PV034 TaxID=2594495 RepID=UPI00223F4E28|nr:mechanosensitive ion channel domain-containing protein [Lactobacillus sp. PV034]QNQ81474.1 mechanosensitive ion channel [Lactobacillus sp. PV034]
MNYSSFVSKYKATSNKISPIDWDDVAHNLLGKTIQLAITSVIFLIIWRIGKTLIAKYVINNSKFKNKITGRKRTLSELSMNIFQYTLLLFYLYSVLSILGLPVGTLVASAGIVSLALGMGAQGFVSDMVNGLVILSEGQFDVGDIVKIGNYTGTVQALGLRTTRLKNYDGTITYIPNRNITVVENVTRGGIGVDINLQVSVTTDLHELNQIIETTNELLKGTFKRRIKKGPTIVGLTGQNGNILTYNIHFQVVSGWEAKVKNTYLSEYIKALKKHNIALS